jgi:hypothetical protein
MRHLSILLSFTCLFLLVAPVQAQVNNKNNSIGIQFNPYLNSQFFDGISRKYVFAVRYGFNIKDHLSFGPEFSGFYMHHSITKFTDFNFGGFVRYTFLPAYRIKPFLELSPYYCRYNYQVEPSPNWEGFDGKSSYFSGYLSPGLSLCTKNRKFSLDLMYKFSITNNPEAPFANSKKSVFSYRFNFNF